MDEHSGLTGKLDHAYYEQFRQRDWAGWSRLVMPLISQCEREGCGIAQIKEKFGGLRFYLASGGSMELEQMIDEAEAASLKTCEVCGAEGQARSVRGWVRTLCEQHLREAEAKVPR